MRWKSFITKIYLYRVKASVICKPGLYRAWDIVGKAGLRCHAYCKTVRRMRVWFHYRQCWDYGFTKTLPINVGHLGRLLEKISNFPLFPTRQQTTGTSRLISSPQFFSLQCLLSSLIVCTSHHCKFFDLWPSFRKRPFWFAKFIWLNLLQMHLWLNFFCRDLTCIVYFKRNAYVRMAIYSNLSSFLHNELLSNKFETPDVNFKHKTSD